jgi:ribosome-associated protein
LRYSKSIRNPKSEDSSLAPVLFKVQPEEILPVEAEFITLGQFLKAVNVIGTGGEAKFYLAENVVKVNGEPEQRRGRKLRPGDLVIAPGAPLTRLTQSDKTENTEDADSEEPNAQALQNQADIESKIQNSDEERHDL